MDRAAYLQLERPSEKEPARRFAAVEPGLFDLVVNLCVEPGKMCMHDMMAIDKRGGMGMAGVHNVQQVTYDKNGARGTAQPGNAGPIAALPTKRYVASVCTTPQKPNLQAGPAPIDPQPLTGAGLRRPGQTARGETLALFENRGPVSRPAS